MIRAAPVRSRTFAIGMALNVAFIVVEVAFGVGSRSLALLADAGHNLGDVLGLGLAWTALVLGQRPPTDRHTYGWRRASITHMWYRPSRSGRRRVSSTSRWVTSAGRISGNCSDAFA